MRIFVLWWFAGRLLRKECTQVHDLSKNEPRAARGQKDHSGDKKTGSAVRACRFWTTFQTGLFSFFRHRLFRRCFFRHGFFHHFFGGRLLRRFFGGRFFDSLFGSGFLHCFFGGGFFCSLFSSGFLHCFFCGGFLHCFFGCRFFSRGFLINVLFHFKVDDVFHIKPFKKWGEMFTGHCFSRSKSRASLSQKVWPWREFGQHRQVRRTPAKS